jgi:hypothetical protein
LCLYILPVASVLGRSKSSQSSSWGTSSYYLVIKSFKLIILLLLSLLCLFSVSLSQVYTLLFVATVTGLVLGCKANFLLGFILGLIWVGGLMILLTYMLILVTFAGTFFVLPLNCFLFLSFLLFSPTVPPSTFSLLVLSSCFMNLMSLVLLVTMLCVIFVIDLSKGKP